MANQIKIKLPNYLVMRLLTIVCLGVVLAAAVFGQKGFGQRGKPLTRVKPPPWTPDDAADVFFKNVFEEALIGSRPEAWRLRTPESLPPTSEGGRETLPPPASSSDGPWTSIISPSTIESEIKRLKQHLDKTVTSPARFASGDHLKARGDFSLLAVMFAIVADYNDDSIRWKKDATTARNEFARVATVAKVNSEQAFQMAKARKQDLADLISGNAMADANAPTPADWSDIAIRAALMKRLEAAFEAEMSPALANSKTFKRASSELVYQSQIAAAIATVLVQEGMEDGSEEDYQEYCQQIREAADQIKKALENNDYELARSASGAIRNACDQCHESFRT